MTLRQWIKHFIVWLRSFPAWNEEDHLWTGLLGSDEEDCLICHAHRVLSDEELLEEELDAWQALSSEALKSFEDKLKVMEDEKEQS